MDFIGQFVLSPTGIWVACLSIVFGTVYAAIAFHRRISPIIHSLGELIEKIQDFDGEKGFSDRYEELNSWIKSTPLLKFTWSEFTETLILEPGENVKNTHDAETFFNETTIISPFVNLRFYNSLPNIITGAGILGTFIGLVFGIDSASATIANTASAMPADDALKGLLHGASIAFMTSISGLSCSMVFSWYEKHFLNKAQGLIRTWNTSLDERLQRVSPERVAIDTFREIEQQTKELKAFNTDLVWSITAALDEQIAGKLGPILSEILEVSKQMRDNRDLTNEEMLKTVVDEFKEAIQASAGKEMTALGNTLGDLNEQFSAQASGMATSHAEMVASTHEIIDKVSTVLKESVDGLSNTLENIDFAASAMSETANKFLSVTEQLSGSFEQLETVSRRLENVSLTLEEAGDGLKELNSSQLQAVTEIREGVDKVHTSQETISRAWEAYSKRFDQVDSHLEKFFVGLQEGLVGYTEQVNKFLHDIDGHLANSVDKLGGASGEINENVENLSDQLDALRHVFASLNQATSTPV